MKESRPPQREAARFSDHVNRRSKDSSLKKLQKITNKNLHSAFNSVPEETTEISKESVDSSPVSEISDANHIEDNSDERSQTLVLPDSSSQKFLDFTISQKLITDSDFKPTSKIDTEIGKVGSTCADFFGSSDVLGSEDTSVETEVGARLLRDAQSEIRKSADVASKYKKLLDGLIDITVQEFHALPNERDHFAEILSMKSRILFVVLLLWFIVVSVLLFSCSGERRKYIGPLPT